MARALRPKWLLTLLGLCVVVLKAEITCPVLPSTCTCTVEDDAKLSVSCDGAILGSLFKDLGNLPLDKLKISNCSQPFLDVLPKTSIRYLELSNCGIKGVDAKIFRQLANSLEELSLADNRLNAVPDLGSLPKLIALNLNGNQLTDIAAKALDGQKNLRFLRLERNRICALNRNALTEVKNTLELLDLSDNCLSSIPAQNIRNCGRLMYLDLSDNKIAEINNFELMNLPLLREIRLNNNQLNLIHPMAFMNVPQLQFLYMRDNLISNLDGNRLQAFQQLEILDVTNNLLQKLPSLKDLQNLKQVRLDGNLIDKIETLAFSNNPKLQLISIQDNNISQISRNSFDSLDELIILLLTNNSIPTIERGMFDGMKNLQQLNLRNNTITRVHPSAFTSLPHMTVIDLAYNKITEIDKETFSGQGKLFWLDISNNKISSFQKDTFTKKIANILLDGNQLVCDEAFDWFVQYLVSFHVRTFLPFQPEISCVGPAKYAGVRLKDLMMKKANDTINEGMKTLGLNGPNSQRSLISSFIPGLNGIQGAVGSSSSFGNVASGIPVLGTLTQAIPSLRNFPGMNLPTGTGAQNVPTNRKLNSAIEQFTAPLVRFATGGQPVASDIEQLIQSIPNFVVNVPGLGDVDIRQLDPNLVAHVLRGGQIPGIPKETLDGIIQQYMLKMHEAASAANAGKLRDSQSKFLPPVNTLPKELVTSVMEGEPLPGLNHEQTKTISEYYTKSIAVEGSNNSGRVGSLPLTPESLEMLKMLPPGYNISKIPAEIIHSISRGEVPDLTKLPQDLLNHFKTNTDKMAVLFSKATVANASIDEILSKLPKFEKPVLATFSPYDINQISSEMIHEEEEALKAAKIRTYTAIALGLVGTLTIIVLGFFVIYLKKQRQSKVSSNQTFTHNAHVTTIPGAPLANSTMRDAATVHLRHE
ncbi:unnamed protein product [Auanema sp. JU1783]|nr:unnamed protein product [Auanema sp. JU1783]